MRTMAFEKAPEPAAPKPTSQSATVWFALMLALLDFIPKIQEILLQYFPQFMDTHGNLIVAIVILLLRFKTKGPLAGVGGAIGLGVNLATGKAVGGLKKGLSVIPGVNLR